MARRVRDPRPAGAAGTVAEQLAEGLAGTGGPLRQHVAEGLRDLGAVDLAVYSAVADTSTPSLDERLRRLSNAANNSGLWFAIAAALALAGGGAGRRAALRGTLAIGAKSGLVNLAVESIWARRRPDRAGAGVRSGVTCGCRPPRRSRPATRRRGSPCRGHRPGSALARPRAALPGGGRGILRLLGPYHAG